MHIVLNSMGAEGASVVEADGCSHICGFVLQTVQLLDSWQYRMLQCSLCPLSSTDNNWQ